MQNAGTKDGKGEELRAWDPLTAEEVAQILRVPKRRVRQLGIPAVQLGPNTLRYFREDVEEFLRKRRVGWDVQGGRKRRR
ncbi:MAG: helix-turn-helix domain-containing protein [Gemmatimonadales bacterium]